MYRLKRSDLTESIYQASTRATNSTFQAANSTTFLHNKETGMTFEVEYTDEFAQWWEALDSGTQTAIDAIVKLLEEKGTNLPFPYSSGIEGSRYRHLRELRVQHKREPYRILYAFDPRRVAVLLLGGSKAGNNRWYEENVPKAEQLYDELLKELKDEGLI